LKTLVTGGAGFIGTNLIEELQRIGDEVVVIDDFSSSFLESTQIKNVETLNYDLSNPDIVDKGIFESVDRIIHLAANVDNRFSWNNPHLSIRSNVDATLNLALAARNFEIPKIIYASTGTIYGDLSNPPFLEMEESSKQTTLYGATKYAAEGILSVFATHYGIKTTVFRFVGVLGPHSSHGHLFDFVSRLRLDPTTLNVLGDGNQKKAYVHVSDLINGILSIESEFIFDVFNLGRPDYSTVRESVSWLCEEWGISPTVNYEKSDRGWIGDNPFLQLNVEKALRTGWVPQMSIEESVKATVRWMLQNQSIFS
jgi:UDP-glucose 4-epimerase